MAFVDELDALDPARVHIWPDDEYGIPDGKKILSLAPEGAALYTCGPPAMIATIRAEVPSERIETLHFERFSAAPVIGGTAFDIVLSSTGETVHVGADQTALAALREVRPAIAYSCQQGSCGTCPVRYLDGEIEHKDSCLPDAARSRQVAICVSRANGTVTLDL
jgi:ferredoxin